MVGERRQAEAQEFCLGPIKLEKGVGQTHKNAR